MINQTNTMAMIIDYQERLLPAMDEPRELAKQTEILIRGLKELDIPMVITQQYTQGLGMSESFVFEAAQTQEFMDKIEFSAMKDTEIIKEVNQIDKENIIVCGIEAHICVLQTCLDLKEQGFTPYLVLDCIGSRKRSDWEMTIIRAQQEGIIVTSAESVLFELLEKAGSATFKTISRLIR